MRKVKANISMSIYAPDLRQRPPRSPRVRLGNYVILPRLLDKGRATLVGKNGEFHYDCPLDQRFFAFTGIKAALLKKQLARGWGDEEVLQWINRYAKTKPSRTDILAWSAYQEQRVATDVASRKIFNDYHAQAGAHREDIATWFDLLDLDDYVSFGGKA